MVHALGLTILFFLIKTPDAISQDQMNVYLLPGQGSDERLFSKLTLDSSFSIHHISLPTPDRGISLKDYSRIISSGIDTSKPFILIGVSMGGMVCSEMADYLKAEKIIIVSSAKCRRELPFRYRFQKHIPLSILIPGFILKLGAKVLQPVVEPDRNRNKDTFKSMLGSKPPLYYKRTIRMIMRWDKTGYSDKIIHIHGTDDHTIPIKNISYDYKIEEGSHMMMLTRGDELNKLILSILQSRENNKHRD